MSQDDDDDDDDDDVHDDDDDNDDGHDDDNLSCITFNMQALKYELPYLQLAGVGVGNSICSADRIKVLRTSRTFA